MKCAHEVARDTGQLFEGHANPSIGPSNRTATVEHPVENDLKMWRDAIVVETCNAAPASEMFRTVHSSFGAFSLITMNSLFKTLWRELVRFSITAGLWSEITVAHERPLSLRL
jgi:hypothetical protein